MTNNHRSAAKRWHHYRGDIEDFIVNDNNVSLAPGVLANARATANLIAAEVSAGRDPEGVIHTLCRGDGRFWVRQALCVNAAPAN